MEFVYGAIKISALLFLAYYSVALTYHLSCRRRRTGIGKDETAALSTKCLMVVFGSGGHTTEMLHMLQGLEVGKYGRVCFVVGHSDSWTPTKLQSFLPETQLKRVTHVRLFRAREVKQSYLTSILTTLVGLLDSVKVILQHRPDLIVTNGPGTAVPLCYASYFI